MFGRRYARRVVATSGAPGLRERKKQRIRAQLTDAALRLFSERGFDGVTVEEIAAEVEVSPRTFFRYFGSKEDVLFGDSDETLAELRDVLASRPLDEPVLTAVRHAILALAQAYETERDLILLRGRIMRDTTSLRAHGLERQTAWEGAITEAVADRLGADPAADLRPRMVAGCAVVALRAAATTWLERGGGDDLSELVAEALDLLGALDVHRGAATAP